jgi:hypothetical protein
MADGIEGAPCKRLDCEDCSGNFPVETANAEQREEQARRSVVERATWWSFM